MTLLTDRAASFFSRRPMLLFVTLYSALALLAFAAVRTLPESFQAAIDSLTNSAGLGAFDNGAFARSRPEGTPPTAPLWAIGTIAMGSAGLLALPVAWLYTITRQKRGYNQSVVQSLILLPVVVAGVVVLVKFSLALAFSLAGIVAAVRFRNTLEDSKDAVYIFVVTGIGLAAGVELSAAAALSVVFNFTTLLLFKSDFGRTPGHLEGAIAERRMERALSMANRTGEFVARLDAEVFDEMAPEQLEAVANRAWRRRGDARSHDVSLHVRTIDVQATRTVVEQLLTVQAKKWHFVRVEGNIGGEQLLIFGIRLRKSVQPTAFLDTLRAQGAPHLIDAELT